MKTNQQSASQARPRTRSRSVASRTARGAVAIAAWACFVINPALAQVAPTTLPTGPKVNVGQATVSTVGSAMSVNQATAKASLDWQSFSIGSSASVVFNQPSASSIALNRVVGTDPSQIFGSLSANGQVFLINPAGIVFAPGARVNVGGIAASTLNITDGDFVAGRYVFSGDSTASVVNRGAIITAPGGYAALIGANAANEGSISAPGGSVALAAGSRVTMDLAGDGLISLSVDAAAVQAMASNSGLIQADGGRVILSARAADALAGTVLNQTGMIEARSASVRNGEIVLDGGSTGIVAVSGKLDASGTQAGATGGSITVTGNKVGLYGADINASGDTGGGTILIGGDRHGDNPAVRNAFRTYVDADSRLNADAVTIGNGGKIIVWSDDVTRFGGSISARGGAQGGDGGFAEVSGKGSLVIAKSSIFDLGAPKGNAGTLLFDPTDIEVITGGLATLTQVDEFSDAGALNQIDPGTIAGATANVVLQAENDITFTSAVTMANPNIGITAQAGNDIFVNAPITTSNGRVHLEADSPHATGGADGNGAVFISSPIVTNNGNVTLIGRSINVFSTVSAGSGAISIARSEDGAAFTTGDFNDGITFGGTTTLVTTSTLTLGRATSGGTDGNGAGAVQLTAGTFTVNNAMDILAANVATGVSFIANNGITLNAPVTTHQPTTINADANQGDNTGTLNISGGFTLSTSGNTLSITANTLNLNSGTGFINSGAAATTIIDSDNTGIGLGDSTISNGLNISGLDLQGITATGLTLQTGGNILVDNISALNSANIAGTTTLTANGTTSKITFQNNASFFNALAANASDRIAVNADVTTVVGNLALDGDANNASNTNDDITFSAGRTLTSAGSLTLDATTGGIKPAAAVSLLANNGVTINDNVTLGAAGNVVINADNDANSTGRFTLVTGTTLNTTGGDLTVTADEMNIQGGITATGAVVSLRPSVTSQLINIGSTVDTTANTLELSGTEIANVNALTLRIGSKVGLFGGTVDAGSITVSQDVTPSNITNLHLISGGGGVDGTTGGILGNKNLAITAANTVLINDPQTAIGTLAINNPGFDVTLVESNGFTVGTVDTVVGIAAKNVTLTTSPGGDVSVSNPIVATGPISVTLSGANNVFSVADGIDVGTTTGGIVVNADNINLNSTGTLTATGQTVTLRPQTAGVLINLGGADSAGTLGLASTELDNVTATNLIVGRANAGAITVSSTVSPVNVTNFHLITGAGVTGTAGGIVVGAGAGNLAIEAVGTVNMTNTATSVNDVAISNAGNSVTFVEANGFNVSTVDGVIGISGSSVNLTAVTGGITVVDTANANDINATGAVTATLQQAEQKFTVSTLANVQTTTGGITVNADKMDIAGTLTAAGQTVTLRPQTGGGAVAIKLGNVGDGTANTLELSSTGPGNEIDNVTAGVLKIGSSTSGNLTVTDAIAPANTTTLSLETGGTIAQLPTATITETNVALRAGTGITLNEANAVDVLAATTTAAGDIAFTNSQTMTVTTVDSVNGVSTFDGNINIAVSSNSASATDLLIDRISSGGGVTRNVTVSAVNAGAGGASILEAPGGGTGDVGIDITTAGQLSMTATTQIGQPTGTAAGPIEIAAGSLTFVSGGATYLAQTGDISLGALTSANDFAFTANGNVTVTGILNLDGNTSLEAIGANHDLIVSNNINRTNDAAGTINLIATRNIVFRAGADLTAQNATGGGAGATAVTLNADRDALNGGAIYVNTGSTLTSNNGAVVMGGGATPSAVAAIGIAGSDFSGTNVMRNGIVIEGQVVAGAGNVTLLGQSWFDSGLALNTGIAGVAVKGGGDIVTTTGNITMVGIGDRGIGTTQGVFIDGAGTTVTTDSGIVTILGGHNTPTRGNSNVGVLVSGGAVVSSTSTATSAGLVKLQGVGGPNDAVGGPGNFDNGVVVTGTGTIVSVDGASLKLVGVGGSGGANGGVSNVGVQVAAGADVKTIGAGVLTLDGTGGATNGGGNVGIEITGTGTQVRSTSAGGTAGGVILLGTGGVGTGSGDGGVLVASSAQVSTTAGAISIDGKGAPVDATGGAQNYGVQIAGAAQVTTNGAGTIGITGTGAGADGGQNFGLWMQTGGVVQSTPAAGGGAITVNATGGSGAGANDTGVFLDTSSVITSKFGNIVVTGTGGTATASASGASNIGVEIDGGAKIETTSVANVTVDGTGGVSTGDGNYGVRVNGGIVQSTATGLLSGTGLVNIKGTGGAGSGLNDYGVSLEGASGAVTTKTGNINIQGFGGLGSTAGSGAVGVSITGATVRTDEFGNVLITGIGGDTTGGSNHGIFTGGAASISSTIANGSSPAGTVTLTGTAGAGAGDNDKGVSITGSTAVSSKDGAITIFGTGGTGGGINNYGTQIVGTGAPSANVTSTGLAAISITGLGGAGTDGNRGVSIESGAAVRGASTSSGNITIAGTAGGTADANYGVVIASNSATVESLGTGNIGITGIAGGTVVSLIADSNVGVLVDQSGVVSTAKTGTITITGTGGGDGGGNVGVQIGNNALVASTQGTAGGGSITITGTGAAGTNGNDGVRLIDADTGANASGTAAAITSLTGAISITGNRGNATGSSNIGVNLAQNALVQNQSGTTTIIGQGAAGAASNGNVGVLVTTTGASNGSTVKSNGTGSVTITGTGAGAGTDNVGVQIGNNSLVASIQTAAGGGSITVTGSGSAGTNFNDGVRLVDSDLGANASGTAAAITSGSGAIAITGNRGNVTVGAGNVGVNLAQNALVDTQTGGITIIGQGAAGGATSSNIGVLIATSGGVGGSTVRTTGSGNIAITGTGVGTGDNNVGVLIGDDSRAVSTSTGTITITGTGSNGLGTAPLGNDGVRIKDTVAAAPLAGVVSSGGAISITGNRAGGVTGAGNDGIEINGTTLVEATGAGGITLLGQGTTASLTDGTTANNGVLVTGGAIVRSTAAGNIGVTGTGSGTTGTNHGISVQTASLVAATGAGTVTLTGTGGGTAAQTGANNIGVNVDASTVSSNSAALTIVGTGGATTAALNRGVVVAAAGTVTSATGSVAITGTGMGTGLSNDGVLIDGGSTIGSTGSATIAVTGTGAPGGMGIIGATGGNLIGGASAAGTVTLTGLGADSGIDLNGTNITTTGAAANVVITSPDKVTLGGVGGGGVVNAGASTVTITTNTDAAGAANTEGFTQASGSITTTNATAGAVSITANTGGGGTGDILFRGITTGAAGTITLNSNAGDINEQAGGAGLLTATAGTVALSATGTGAIGFFDTAGVTNQNPVRTNTANVTATTANGTISILETDSVTFTTVTTGTNNRIDLQALTGNITVGTIGAGTGPVNILARAGSILDDGSNATRITGNVVTLNAGGAAGSIGTSAANFEIDTTAQQIAAKSGTGGTFINETDAVVLTQTAAPITANAVIFAGNTIASTTPAAIDTLHSTGGDYVLTAGGTITTSAPSGFTMNGNTLITATGAASDIVFSDSVTRTNAAAGTFGMRADNSIKFVSSADLTAITGALAITLNSDRDASGAGAILLDTGTVVTSNGGAIVLGGGATPATVAATGTATDVIGVRLNNAQLLSGAGAITVTGQGMAGVANSHGVSFDTGSVVQSSTGVITVKGTGGAGTGGNVGVNVEGAGSRITSTGAAGNILVTGFGGASTGDNNNGVSVRTGGAKIEATGSGTVTIAGTRGNGANNNDSVFIDGAVTTNTGALLITGNAGGTVTGTGNSGVLLSGGTVSSTGGTVGITGTGGAGTDANVGVRVTSTGQVTSTVAGITITGTGAGTGAGNDGVLIELGSDVTGTTTAGVTMTGTAGAGTGANNVGVLIQDSGTTVTGVDGVVNITGTGAGAGGSGSGVVVQTLAQVQSTGTGGIVVGGTGSSGGGTSNVGVAVTGDADVGATGAGGITITGTGGTTTGTGNSGVLLAGAGTTVTSTSSAISVTGTGHGTGGSSVGVGITGTALVGTATGSALITGTGAGAQATDFGVSMTSGTVQSTGTAAIALVGGGAGVAADISTSGGGNTISNVSGDILLRSVGSVGMISDATITNNAAAGSDVTLNMGGGGLFNQAAGTINTAGLRVLGSGTFTLGQANTVTTIAGNLSAGSVVTLNDAGGVDIGTLTTRQTGVAEAATTSTGLNVAGNVNVTTTGAITQTSPAVISGITTLDAGGNAVTLTNGGNDFGTVNVANASDVQLTDGNNLDLGNITPTGTLTVNAGALTDSGTIVVPGVTAFNVGGNMLLDSPASDFSSVTFNVGGSATLTDVNALIVNTSNVAGALTLFTGGALNSNGLVSVGTANFTVASGGIGTLHAPFTLNTDNLISLTITGTVSGSPAAGFVVNFGSGLLNLLPPTGLVQFQIVEFQPPRPATAASFLSVTMSEVTQEENTDELFTTDDPEGMIDHSFRGRIGQLPNGADVNRDGGIRMPPGLQQGQDSGRSFVPEDEEERRRRTRK